MSDHHRDAPLYGEGPGRSWPSDPDSSYTPDWRLRPDPDVVPSSSDVLDPDLGSDGGGHLGGVPLPTNDLDELTAAGRPADLVVCPRCGTGVDPDRLRD